MSRIKRGSERSRKRAKIMSLAKGYRGAKSRSYRRAKEQVMHSLMYAYRDRRDKKGQFRTLWISRIGAAARENGLSYSRLMHGLKLAGVDVDRKILSDMAINDPEGFTRLADVARGQVN
jgi:large subunit ribosomal protein L20